MTPYQKAVIAGFHGTENDWLSSMLGDVGFEVGNARNGANAYELAVAYQQFTGSIEAWLLSIRGEVTPEYIAIGIQVGLDAAQVAEDRLYVTATHESIATIFTDTTAAKTAAEAAKTVAEASQIAAADSADEASLAAIAAANSEEATAALRAAADAALGLTIQAKLDAISARNDAQYIKNSTEVLFDIQGRKVGIRRLDMPNFVYTEDLTGPAGPGFKINDSFNTEAELIAAYPDGSLIDGGFVVGTEIPQHYFFWAVAENKWKDGGPLQGASGLTAYQGAVFHGLDPDISEEAFYSDLVKVPTHIGNVQAHKQYCHTLSTGAADNNKWSKLVSIDVNSSAGFTAFVSYAEAETDEKLKANGLLSVDIAHDDLAYVSFTFDTIRSMNVANFRLVCTDVVLHKYDLYARLPLAQTTLQIDVVAVRGLNTSSIVYTSDSSWQTSLPAGAQYTPAVNFATSEAYGVTKLNDTLTSDSDEEALTAKQGKELRRLLDIADIPVATDLSAGKVKGSPSVLVDEDGTMTVPPASHTVDGLLTKENYKIIENTLHKEIIYKQLTPKPLSIPTYIDSLGVEVPYIGSRYVGGNNMYITYSKTDTINHIMTSLDGITWNEYVINLTGIFSLDFVGGKFFLYGLGFVAFAATPLAATDWVVTLLDANTTYRDIEYFNNTYYLLSNIALIESTDGFTWIPSAIAAPTPSNSNGFISFAHIVCDGVPRLVIVSFTDIYWKDDVETTWNTVAFGSMTPMQPVIGGIVNAGSTIVVVWRLYGGTGADRLSYLINGYTPQLITLPSASLTTLPIYAANMLYFWGAQHTIAACLPGDMPRLLPYAHYDTTIPDISSACQLNGVPVFIHARTSQNIGIPYATFFEDTVITRDSYPEVVLTEESVVAEPNTSYVFANSYKYIKFVDGSPVEPYYSKKVDISLLLPDTGMSMEWCFTFDGGYTPTQTGKIILEGNYTPTELLLHHDISWTEGNPLDEILMDRLYFLTIKYTPVINTQIKEKLVGIWNYVDLV